jgi:hypothetical protein
MDAVEIMEFGIVETRSVKDGNVVPLVHSHGSVLGLEDVFVAVDGLIYFGC